MKKWWLVPWWNELMYTSPHPSSPSRSSPYTLLVQDLIYGRCCCRCRDTFVGIFHSKCQIFFCWHNSFVQFMPSTPTPPRQEHKDYGSRTANRRQLPQFRFADVRPYRSHHVSIHYGTRSWTWFVDFRFASLQKMSSQLHILQNDFGIGNDRIEKTCGSDRSKMKFQAVCRKDRLIGRYWNFGIHKAFDIPVRPSELLIWHGRTIDFPSIRLIFSPILIWSIENQSNDSRGVVRIGKYPFVSQRRIQSRSNIRQRQRDAVAKCGFDTAGLQ